MAGFYFLNEDAAEFPPVSDLTGSDLAVIGSNMKPETILKAYRKGYFPWYSPGEPRCWFHPDPRMVLFPADLKVSRSMRPYLNGGKFRFLIDKHFSQVISGCRNAKRGHETAVSWISDEIVDCYSRLFEQGYAHCAETWSNGKLVGGLYGLRLGKVFFGESMFAEESNASKFAFIKFVKFLQSTGVEMIDCQQQTSHIASLGAHPISRGEFARYLEKLIPENSKVL